MTEYVFTLTWQLGPLVDHDDVIARFAAAGADDVLLGVGMAGRIGMEFCREARSAAHAIRDAQALVRRLLPGAALIEVLPDFAGLTDIADRVGVSRQNMRKLMTANPGSFPLPAHDGSAGVWHLAEVLAWLSQRAGYDIDEALVETALAAWQCNLDLAAARLAAASVRPKVAG